MRMCMFIVLGLSCVAVARAAPPSASDGTRQIIVRPNPELARVRAAVPDQQEMDKIEKLVGRDSQAVLRCLGHPNMIKTKDGPINLPKDVSEIWQFCCQNGPDIWVEYRNGIVKKTYLQWGGQIGLGNFMFLGQFPNQMPEN